ncbi:hypothetical protein GQ53DRAFT_818635 [Thozetella sp. PMI_491]|nr:hypothetical protein GQ53DRAFT_818635 [Thozetella sp. PMI_491]
MIFHRAALLVLLRLMLVQGQSAPPSPDDMTKAQTTPTTPICPLYPATLSTVAPEVPTKFPTNVTRSVSCTTSTVLIPGMLLYYANQIFATDFTTTVEAWETSPTSFPYTILATVTLTRLFTGIMTPYPTTNPLQTHSGSDIRTFISTLTYTAPRATKAAFSTRDAKSAL